MKDRHDRGLGYPSCTLLQGLAARRARRAHCSRKGKSPLNIRPAVIATVTGASSTSGSSGPAIWTGRSGISFYNIPHRQWLYGLILFGANSRWSGRPAASVSRLSPSVWRFRLQLARNFLGRRYEAEAMISTALVINAEDSSDEIRRRICAFCLAHSVAERDLGRLDVVGADDPRVQRLSFCGRTKKTCRR